MATNNQNMTTQVIGKGLMVTFMIVPTAISIFLAFEVRSIEKKVINSDIEIVCFAADDCAIEAYGKLYRIDEVIVQEDIIPEDYLLEAPVEETEEPKFKLRSNKPTE